MKKPVSAADEPNAKTGETGWERNVGDGGGRENKRNKGEKGTDTGGRGHQWWPHVLFIQGPKAMSAPSPVPSPAFSQEPQDMEEINLTLPHRGKLSSFLSLQRGGEVM